MPNAAGFMHRALLALHLAVQRRVLPEVMFGRGIDGFSYTTSAEVQAGPTAAEFCGGLMEVRSAVRVSKKSKTVISGYFSKLSMSKKSKPPIGVDFGPLFLDSPSLPQPSLSAVING